MSDQSLRDPPPRSRGATRLRVPPPPPRDQVAPRTDSAVVDCALYQDGRRHEGEVPVAHALDMAREAVARGNQQAVRDPDGRVGASFIWIQVDNPSQEQLDEIAAAFDLHPLAIEDAVHAHERPKLEVYDDVVFAVVKTVHYVDPTEVVEFGDIMLFVGQEFVVTVRHDPTFKLDQVRRDLEAQPDLLKAGPTAVLYAVIDHVVDDYVVAAEGVDNDIEEIEAQVFSGQRTNRAERIYKLKREVLSFRRAVAPLVIPVDRLAHGQVRGLDPRAAEYFRDVRDHLLRTVEQIDGFNQLLDSALEANGASVTLRQNEDMRKIAAWAAVLAWMTMIAGIYGMNFSFMPELDWRFGYPSALAAMFGGAIVLIALFRRRGWL